jgi:hypothetical protein
METKSILDDTKLRAITVASTGLGFACMVGSLAAVRMNKGGFQMQWHWSIVIVAAVAFIWNSRLWKAIWQLQEDASAKAKRRLAFHLAVLVALGLGAFLYPLSFAEADFRHDAMKGLMIAAPALGIVCLLLYTVGRGFKEVDAIELRRQAGAAKEKLHLA